MAYLDLSRKAGIDESKETRDIAPTVLFRGSRSVVGQFVARFIDMDRLYSGTEEVALCTCSQSYPSKLKSDAEIEFLSICYHSHHLLSIILSVLARKSVNIQNQLTILDILVQYHCALPVLNYS